MNANPATGSIVAGTATATILPSSTTGGFSPNTTTPPTTATCNYPAGVGSSSCTVQITAATAGVTDVQASSAISQVGVTGSLTRTTGTAENVTAGCTSNCDNATKKWADVVVTTHVRDAANNDITNSTTVTPGTVVHDEATVTRTAATPASVPNPTGSVSFTLFSSLTCTGTVVATDPNKPLDATGLATSATFTTPAAGGPFSYLAHNNGDANYPARDAGCEPFTVTLPPQGQITPTNVECSDILGGTAPTLGQINYPVSGGKIGQGINPGVFFFWTKITTTVPNQVVTVSQSNTSTNNAALFLVHQGWDRVYAGDCSSWRAGTETAGGSGASFTIPKAGSYIIGIKYQTKSIAGTTAPVPANITYNFTTSLGGTTGASVLLKRQ